MANVLFSRTDSPSTKPITDGQIIFDTSGNGKMYLDNGTTRLEMGGAINVDATLDATSTNPIQNKGVAGVMLGELEEIRGVTRKGFLTDALATKTLDAKIGTTDISSIGDGTVTGAISDVNGKLDKSTFDFDNRIMVTDNIFTCQTDGYLRMYAKYGNEYIVVSLNSQAVSCIAAGNCSGNVNMYVKKGMTLKIQERSSTTNTDAFFLPLI